MYSDCVDLWAFRSAKYTDRQYPTIAAIKPKNSRPKVNLKKLSKAENKPSSSIKYTKSSAGEAIIIASEAKQIENIMDRTVVATENKEADVLFRTSEGNKQTNSSEKTTANQKSQLLKMSLIFTSNSFV